MANEEINKLKLTNLAACLEKLKPLESITVINVFCQGLKMLAEELQDENIKKNLKTLAERILSQVNNSPNNIENILKDFFQINTLGFDSTLAKNYAEMLTFKYLSQTDYYSILDTLSSFCKK